MTDPVPCFRSAREEAAFDAVSAELAARVRHRIGDVPEAERGEWRRNLLTGGEHWSSVREWEAYRAFREPTDPEAAVVADALIRAGTVTDALYARLLVVADREHARFLHYAGEPVTRAVAFDAFGTLVRIPVRRRPYERLIARARDRAAELPSPMTAGIGLADYAVLLGLPHPDAELAMLADELASIELYPDVLDALRRVRDQGITLAVASNLAKPYAEPLMALLGVLVDVWHFSFAVGDAKPQPAFYDALTARLGIEAGELLMVGDTWTDDVAGAIDAGARARWLDREGRGGYVHRFIAVGSLDDIGWNLRTAAEPTARTG